MLKEMELLAELEHMRYLLKSNEKFSYLQLKVIASLGDERKMDILLNNIRKGEFSD